jgi:hypothetical protein
MADKVEDWTDDPPPSRHAGWFPTKELIAIIEEATLCGATAARKTINRAFWAGLIDRWRGGQGWDQKVAWRITDLGHMWIGDGEEDAVHGFFHIDQRKPPRQTGRRPTGSTGSPPKPPKPLALPRGKD